MRKGKASRLYKPNTLKTTVTKHENDVWRIFTGAETHARIVSGVAAGGSDGYDVLSSDSDAQEGAGLCCLCTLGPRAVEHGVW